MKSPFCILAAPDDIHALSVREALDDLGYRCAIVDFGSGLSQIALGVEDDEVTLQLDDVRLDSSTIVWSRRPGARAVDPRVVDQRLVEFTQLQWRHSLIGGLAAIGCRIVNDPTAERAASYKPFQLKQAAASGLRVPATLITNSPSQAHAFRRRMEAVGRRTVYKPLTGLKYHLGETREFTESTDTGDTLTLAPVIFQECVERGRDLRVFVAGDRLVAAAVVTAHNELIDWRLDPLSGFESFDLRDDLSRSIMAAVRGLGLHTASVDLRVDPAGKAFFFEANPGGQFLMLDQGTGLQTARFFAQSLIDLDDTRAA